MTVSSLLPGIKMFLEVFLKHQKITLKKKPVPIVLPLPPVTAALCALIDDVNHPQTCFA